MQIMVLVAKQFETTTVQYIITRAEEASEQAEEGVERHHSDEDERLVLATVEVVRNLGEERRH